MGKINILCINVESPEVLELSEKTGLPKGQVASLISIWRNQDILNREEAFPTLDELKDFQEVLKREEQDNNSKIKDLFEAKEYLDEDYEIVETGKAGDNITKETLSQDILDFMESPGVVEEGLDEALVKYNPNNIEHRSEVRRLVLDEFRNIKEYARSNPHKYILLNLNDFLKTGLSKREIAIFLSDDFFPGNIHLPKGWAEIVNHFSNYDSIKEGVNNRLIGFNSTPREVNGVEYKYAGGVSFDVMASSGILRITINPYLQDQKGWYKVENLEGNPIIYKGSSYGPKVETNNLVGQYFAQKFIDPRIFNPLMSLSAHVSLKSDGAVIEKVLAPLEETLSRAYLGDNITPLPSGSRGRMLFKFSGETPSIQESNYKTSFSSQERLQTFTALADAFSENVDDLVEVYKKNYIDIIESSTSTKEQKSNAAIEFSNLSRQDIIKDQTPASIFSKMRRDLIDSYLNKSYEEKYNEVISDLADKFGASRLKERMDSNPEEASNYINNVIVDKESMFKRIREFYPQLVADASKLLSKSEGIIINEVGGIEDIVDSNEDFDPVDVQREEVHTEGWQVQYEEQSLKNSVVQKVREQIFRIPVTDPSSNKPSLNIFGKPRYLNGDSAFIAIQEQLSTMTRREELIPLLEKLAQRNPIFSQMVENVKNDPQLLTAFWNSFVTGSKVYRMMFTTPDGEFKTKTLNLTTGVGARVANWVQIYKQGSKLNSLSVYNEDSTINLHNVEVIQDKTNKLLEYINDVINKQLKGEEDSKILEYLSKEELNVNSSISSILNSFGIDTTVEDINSVSREVIKGKALFHRRILNRVIKLTSNILKDSKSDKYKDTMNKVGLDGYDMYKRFQTMFHHISDIIPTAGEQYLENKFVRDGKTKYTRQTPSYSTTLVQRLKGEEYSSSDYADFLEENYGQYNNFKNKDSSGEEKWLIDTLNSLATDPEFRKQFSLHKLNDIDKIDYEDWNKNLYSASLIHNFFSIPVDTKSRDRQYALYPLPVLSDSTSSEFLKLERFIDKSSMEKTEDGDMELRTVKAKEQIIDKLIGNVHGELNRIRDVRYRRNLLKENEELIKQGKEPIHDIQEIQNLDSRGHKFVTLSGLNNIDIKASDVVKNEILKLTLESDIDNIEERQRSISYAISELLNSLFEDKSLEGLVKSLNIEASKVDTTDLASSISEHIAEELVDITKDYNDSNKIQESEIRRKTREAIEGRFNNLLGIVNLKVDSIIESMSKDLLDYSKDDKLFNLLQVQPSKLLNAHSIIKNSLNMLLDNAYKEWIEHSLNDSTLFNMQKGKLLYLHQFADSVQDYSNRILDSIGELENLAKRFNYRQDSENNIEAESKVFTISRLKKEVINSSKGMEVERLIELNSENIYRFMEGLHRIMEESLNTVNDDITELNYLLNEGNHSEEQLQEYTKELKQKELILSDLLDKRWKQFDSILENISSESVLESNLKNYFYNSYKAKADIYSILISDPALYKNSEDLQKRVKEVYSPKRPLDVNAEWRNPETGQMERVGKEYENSITLYDEVGVSSFISELEDIFKDIKGTANYDAIMSGYNEVEVTDGQAFRGLTSHRRVNIMASRWNDALEASYRRIKRGEYNIADLRAVYGAIKPFTYGYRDVTTPGLDNKIKVGIQHKNSEFTVLTGINKEKDGKSLFTHAQAYSEVLQGIERILEDPELDIDTIQFKSTTKHGNLGLIAINENMTADEVVQAVKDKIIKKDELGNPLKEGGKYQFDENFYVRTKYEYYGEQVATPLHYIDSTMGVGVQMRRALVSNIPNGTTFDVNNTKLNKEEFIDVYNRTWEKLLREKSKELNGLFRWKDTKDRIEKSKRIESLLKAEMKRSTRFSPELVEACSINEKGEFNIPLYESIQSERVQSLLLALFKKKITRYEMPGGSLIQATPWGLNEESPKGLEGKRRPKVIFGKNEKGETYIKEIECIMPWYTKEFFYNLVGEEGINMDLNNLSEEQRKAIDPLLNIIGYRIPTEARYSIFNLKIIDFGAPQSGGHIIMPRELTRVAGFDFDVDKIYFIRPENKVNKVYDTEDFVDSIIEEWQDDTGVSDESLIQDQRMVLEDLVENPRDYLESEDDFLADVADEWLEVKEDYRIPEEDNISKVDYNLTKDSSGKYDVENLSVKQLHNLFLDMAKASLSTPEMVQEQLNPGGYDAYKLQSRILQVLRLVPLEDMQRELSDINWDGDYITEITNKYTISQLEDVLDKYGRQLDILSPVSQVETFQKNVTGVKLIGMYANHLTNHGLAQNTQLKVSQREKFVFADRVLTDLNKAYIDNNLVARAMSEAVAASADNGKDAVLGMLNQSTLTADVTMYLARLGYKIHEVTALLNQPVIEDMIRFMSDSEFNNYKGAFTTYMKTRFNRDLAEYRDKDMTTDVFKKASSMENLSKLLLIYKKNKEGKATKEELKKLNTDSLTLIVLFDRMYGHGSFLNKIIGATKYDSQNAAAGGNLYKTQINAWKAVDLLTLSDSDTQSLPFEGVSTIVPKNNLKLDDIINSPIAPLQAAYTYGLEGALKSMSALFPQLNPLIQREVEEIKKILPTKMNESMLRRYYEGMQTYLLTNIPLFGDEMAEVVGEGYVQFTAEEKREQYLKEFPQYFLRLKYEFEDTAVNGFLRSIVKQNPNRNNPIEYLTFKHVGKMSDSQLQDYQIQWEMLLNHADPSVRKMAISLAVYDFMRTGFSYSTDSYTQLTPNAIKLNMPGYIDELRSWMDKDSSNTTLKYARSFNNQFLLHNLDSESFTPRVSIKQIETVLGRLKMIEDIKKQGVDPKKTMEQKHYKEATLIPIDISPDYSKLTIDISKYIYSNEKFKEVVKGSSSQLIQALTRRIHNIESAKMGVNAPYTLKVNVDGKTIYYAIDYNESVDGIYSYNEVTPLGSYLSGHEYYIGKEATEITPMINESRKAIEERNKKEEGSNKLSIEALETMMSEETAFVETDSPSFIGSEDNQSIEMNISEITPNELSNSILRMISYSEGGFNVDDLNSSDPVTLESAQTRYSLIVGNNLNKALAALERLDNEAYKVINGYRNSLFDKAEQNDYNAYNILEDINRDFTNNLQGKYMINSKQASEILISTFLQQDDFFKKYPGRDKVSKVENLDNILKTQYVQFSDPVGYTQTEEQRIKSIEKDNKNHPVISLMNQAIKKLERQDKNFKTLLDNYVTKDEQKMKIYKELDRQSNFSIKDVRQIDLLTFKNIIVLNVLEHFTKDILNKDESLSTKNIC